MSIYIPEVNNYKYLQLEKITSCRWKFITLQNISPPKWWWGWPIWKLTPLQWCIHQFVLFNCRNYSVSSRAPTLLMVIDVRRHTWYSGCTAELVLASSIPISVPLRQYMPKGSSDHVVTNRSQKSTFMPSGYMCLCDLENIWLNRRTPTTLCTARARYRPTSGIDMWNRGWFQPILCPNIQSCRCRKR